MELLKKSPGEPEGCQNRQAAIMFGQYNLTARA
jgi:hypothetical protein